MLNAEEASKQLKSLMSTWEYAFAHAGHDLSGHGADSPFENGRTTELILEREEHLRSIIQENK